MTLRDFFEKHTKIAVAFSGGVNSSYLLYAAKRAECDVTAYYVCSQLQPAFELGDANRLAQELEAPLRVLECDMLSYPEIAENGIAAPYHYKQALFGMLQKAAKNDGFETLIEGTTISGSDTDEPGRRVLRALGIISPLRMSSLKKADVRTLSKAAGLFTHDKPAYDNLAACFPRGEKITQLGLLKAEAAMHALFELGLIDFKVRLRGESAIIQIPLKETPMLLMRKAEIDEIFSQWFSDVQIDSTYYEPV